MMGPLACGVITGAGAVINSLEARPAQVIEELTRYGVDFSFNTTRSPAIFTQAMGCLAPRGVVGFVGAPPACAMSANGSVHHGNAIATVAEI
jgi:Zn-dependent alcohol dehydrogenase